jgi:hypothetical protein
MMDAEVLVLAHTSTAALSRFVAEHELKRTILVGRLNELDE